MLSFISPRIKFDSDINSTISQTNRFKRPDKYELLTDRPQASEIILPYNKRQYLTNPLYERTFPLIKENNEKAQAIKEAFLHGWNAYKTRCWGEDEYVPHSDSCSSTLHAALTIVDSLSTLYLMNLTEEYQRARDYIQNDFKPSGSWSLFEFLIRFVGGFVSMYELSLDKLYLDKAVECADAVYPLMESGIFGGGVKLGIDQNGKIKASYSSGGGRSVADSNTYQLEFISLSMLTGDPKYIDLAMKTYKNMWERYKNRGLISDSFSGSNLHVGGGIDSYYEYIIKIYVMTRGVARPFLDKYLQIVKDIKEKIVVHSKKSNYTGLGVYSGGSVNPMQEHLGTFAGGMIAVGTVKENPHAAEDLQLADDLTTGYAKAYEFTQTGVGPERVRFSNKEGKDFEIENPVYMLRPESCESVYVMWKFTGLPKFRMYAWNMFSGINKYARKSKGFGHIRDVNNANDTRSYGNQESFFFAETLKYLYLTFADTSLISPAQWVFNTEGHPLRHFTEEEAQKWKDKLNFK